MNKLTVTLNTADSEFSDIEIEVPNGYTITEVLAEAVLQTDITAGEITSYVIVGVTDN